MKTKILLMVCACLFNLLSAQEYSKTKLKISGIGDSWSMDIDQANNLYATYDSVIKKVKPNGIAYNLIVTHNKVRGLSLSNLDTVLYYTTTSASDWKIFKFRFSDSTISEFYNDSWIYPQSIKVQPSTGDIFVMELGGDNGRNPIISSISLTTKIRSVIAGGNNKGYVDGIGTAALFNFSVGNIANNPTGSGMVFSLNSDTLYVCDFNNYCIRKIDISSKTVSTLAGTNTIGFADGRGTAARFYYTGGIEIDNNGTLYVSDKGVTADTLYGNRIRKILPNGTVTTICGTGRGWISNGNLSFVANNELSIIGMPKAMCFNKTYDTLFVSLYQEIIAITKATPTSIESLARTSNKTLKIYPNFVESENNILIESTSIIGNIQIYSITGTLEMDLNNINSSVAEVNLSNLSSGLYILKTDSGSEKFVIKR